MTTDSQYVATTDVSDLTSNYGCTVSTEPFGQETSPAPASLRLTTALGLAVVLLASLGTLRSIRKN
jgi:hypothetical protein